jgi:serine/threonine protein kinase
MESVCSLCKTAGTDLLECGACHQVKYCNVECQKKHWKEHKPDCSYKPPQASDENKKEDTITPDNPVSVDNTKTHLKADDYIQIKQIGVGNFSEILLVKKKDTEGEFAMKMIPKLKLRQLHKENDVIIEKHCLKKLEPSGCVIKLFDTFQDELNLYMIMEYVPGGELWDIVKNFGLKSRSLIKYYTALVIKGIEYIHSKGVVHRDLKPENIMLTKEHKLKFLDFGTARDMLHPEVKGSGNSHKGRKVYEHFVGTPQYMPPEAIRNKGSGYKTDVFALGCMIYQFFAGYPPFLGGSEYLIFTKTLNEKTYYYDFIFDEETIGLIELMIEKDVDKRITLEEVKKHSFFSDIDWEKLPSYEECKSKITKLELYLDKVKHKIMSIPEANPKILEVEIKKVQDELIESTEYDVNQKEVLLKRLQLMYKQGIAHHAIDQFTHGI